MSVKSKRSSKVISGAFASSVLQQAREIAESYQIILHEEDGEFYGRGLELPNVMDDGKTADECVRNTRKALTAAVAYLLESGQAPPPPASENKRTEQVNIRLTREEKLLLEEAAKAKGFRGVSDFVRSTTLAGVH